MTTRHACGVVQRSIERHFRGAAHDELAMRAHLPGCEACRAYYNRRLLVEQLDPGALGPTRRLATALGFAPHASRGFVRGWVPVAAAALLILLFLPRPHAPADFRPRGAVPEPAQPGLWIYRFPSSSKAQPVRDEIRRSDELAFAYRGSPERHYLAVFGRDEHGHVYWYHPEWTDVTLDPEAIPISTDPVRHELPAAIEHKLDGTALELCGVFSRTPRHVREIERHLEHNTAQELERTEGTHVRCQTLRVLP